MGNSGQEEETLGHLGWEQGGAESGVVGKAASSLPTAPISRLLGGEAGGVRIQWFPNWEVWEENGVMGVAATLPTFPQKKTGVGKSGGLHSSGSQTAVKYGEKVV